MKKEKQDIICVSMTTWEGDYMKAVVHMMGNLAANNRVLFIDYAFTFKDLIMGFLGQSNIPVGRMIGMSPRLRKISYHGHELHHLTLPPILPINWINNTWVFDLIMNAQIKLISKVILRKILRKLEFHKPIMINAFNPIMGLGIQKALNIQKSIYYCYDEISAADWCNKHGERTEREYAKQVDLVVVTSSALLESKIKINSNTILIKNGVDFDLFHQAFNESQRSQHNTIGYIGSLDFRVDYNLLIQLITLRPEYNFVFAGRIIDHKNCERLKSFSNVQLLGAKQPSELPGILSQIDVAIIPFVKNEFTRNIYPLKINEYLAAGLPVITTDFADLSDFFDLIYIKEDEVGFSQTLEDAHLNSHSSQLKRIKMAMTNDWSTRKQQLEEAIVQLEY
ncbi:MAG: glycosyltransferase [Cyclobacteriaceae bacterium]